MPELLGTRTAAAAIPQPTVEEKLERVVIDDGFVIVPESTALAYPRPDVVLRAVEGLALSDVALIRARGSHSAVLDDAVELASRWAEIGTANQVGVG